MRWAAVGWRASEGRAHLVQQEAELAVLQNQGYRSRIAQCVLLRVIEAEPRGESSQEARELIVGTSAIICNDTDLCIA